MSGPGRAGGGLRSPAAEELRFPATADSAVCGRPGLVPDGYLDELDGGALGHPGADRARMTRVTAGTDLAAHGQSAGILGATRRHKPLRMIFTVFIWRPGNRGGGERTLSAQGREHERDSSFRTPGQAPGRHRRGRRGPGRQADRPGPRRRARRAEGGPEMRPSRTSSARPGRIPGGSPAASPPAVSSTATAAAKRSRNSPGGTPA